MVSNDSWSRGSVDPTRLYTAGLSTAATERVSEHVAVALRRARSSVHPVLASVSEPLDHAQFDPLAAPHRLSDRALVVP